MDITVLLDLLSARAFIKLLTNFYANEIPLRLRDLEIAARRKWQDVSL